MSDTYLKDLFIDEARSALKRHSGGLDTSDATATAEDILAGKTAYVNGVKVEGIAERSLKKFFDVRQSCAHLFREGGGDIESAISEMHYSDTSNVTDMSSMFYNCSKLTTVPKFDTGKVTSMKYMFSGCSALTTVPKFDTSNVTGMSNMFYNCSKLTTVPKFDTCKVTSMGLMFSNCSALTTVPEFDTSSVTGMSSMFSGCSALTTVPKFDTSKVTDMGSTFSGCSALTTVPKFDTRNVSGIQAFNSMFKNCSKLTMVPELDMRSATIGANQMFVGCSALTTVLLKNIKVSLQVSSGTTYGHLLTVDSLIHLVKELVDVNSSRTLTIGTVNLEKIANVYVKQIEITDEMRAVDDLIDSKLACEVCESTDEGAMLLKDFAYLKKWTLK